MDTKADRISAEGAVKTRRDPLTRDRIIRAALRLMDQEGLEAVSMRRIGRDLGVEAMSLYHHVRDKEDILDSICETVLSDFRVPIADDWEEGARRGAREFRRILLAHPMVLTLMTERKRPLANPNALRAYEFALEVFRTAGLSAADAVKAFHVFGGYIMGFVTMELGMMVGGPEDEAHAQAHQELARMLQKADLPRMREAMPFFMDSDLEAQFEFGLDLLIEGIRARIAAAPR